MATHSCSCLESPMDRGAWLAVAHGVSEAETRLRAEHGMPPLPGALPSPPSVRAAGADLRPC